MALSRALALSLLFLALSVNVHGQLAQTYVSAIDGKDNKTCDFESPCRTVNRAISQTNLLGEVVILHSGPYEPFTVNKAVTVSAAPGVQATITTGPAPEGVLVQAPGTHAVTVRGLRINAAGSNNGIRFAGGRSLTIESCVIDRAGRAAIEVGAPGEVFVSDTTMRNGRSLFDGHGVFIHPVTGTAKVSIEHCRIETGDGFGVYAFSGSKVSVRDTWSVGNASGFNGSATAGSVEMNLENCTADGNHGAGISAFTSGAGTVKIRVSGSSVTNNSLGISSFGPGSSILSRADNTVEGNNADGTFTGVFIPK